jgi:hypothetical protein
MRLKVVAAVFAVFALCVAAGVWLLSSPPPVEATVAPAGVAASHVPAPDLAPMADSAPSAVAAPEPLERATGDMYLPAPAPAPAVVNPPPIRPGAGAGARSMRHARPGGVPKPDDIGCNPPYRWDTTVRPDGIPVKRMKEWCQ